MNSDEQRRPFSIGNFSVTKPVLVGILILAILALGAFSLIRLPQEQFSEVPFYWVNVIVPYPGASAEDLESSVTVPMENAFQGIDKLKRIASTTSEGLVVVRAEFDDGITDEEFRALFQDARTRVAQVRLPDGALDPLVDDFSSSDFLPVVEVIVSGNLPYDQLRQEANSLRDRILTVSDVSDVDIVGLPERQILIELDPGRAASLGLSLNEIIRAIQDQNRSVPAGTLDTGSRAYLLRVLGSVDGIQDVGNVILRRSSTGSGVLRVADVATVSDSFDPDSSLARFNGNPSVSLRVTKVPRGSSVSVVEGTRAIVGQALEDPSNGATLTLFNDSTVQISSSLSVLTSNALIGLVLLVLILWLFIGFRNALMTALGIPVTFALAFIVLDLLGETINTNTLFGLVLVLGLIVDHAIVIIENSYRLEQEGFSRHMAAIKGTDQVVWPVIAATATTVAAFLPLMLLPGTIGKFLRVIPLTVTIALLASTGEALFFLPSHYAEWKAPWTNRSRSKKARSETGAWFNTVQAGYERVLGFFYRHKAIVLVLALVLAAASFSLVPLLQQDLFSAEDFSYFTIDITTGRGSTLAETDAVVRQFEKVLLARLGNDGLLSINTATGQGGTSNKASITVDVAELDEGRTKSIDDIMAEISAETYWIEGTESVFFRKAQNGPPVSPPISFQFTGDAYGQIIGAAQAVGNVLASVDGVFNVEDDYETGSPEFRIRIDQERASELGISVQTVGTFLRTRFSGLEIGQLFQDNEQISLVLRFSEPLGQSFNNLADSSIITDDGRAIPLSTIATLDIGDSPGAIVRVDGKRQITLTADASDSLDLEAVNAQIRQVWEDSLQTIYPDVQFSQGGEFSEFQDLIFDILQVFILGIFLIYLILGAQFNSYSQPLLILLSVPFAFVGVVLFLATTGTPISTTVIYAGVALAGIAVNDAIVLISFINELRATGMSVGDAVRKAGSTRIRPILLTSLTTIAGLLPTAIGVGGTSVVWGPMASTILFGLVFSTLGALFIVPILYGAIYDRARIPNRTEVRSDGR